LTPDDQVIALDQPHRAIICNTIWALTDFTEANGAMRIVPGSHKLGSPRGRDVKGQLAGLAWQPVA
jgi:ectoine hydroxylase-related dioxygenase (phytanoyl-CoA dioxygenase family)